MYSGQRLQLTVGYRGFPVQLILSTYNLPIICTADKPNNQEEKEEK